MDPPAGSETLANLQDSPVVPVDCRPHITFSRPIHDDAHVGVNPQPVFAAAQPPGWEWIGDPQKNEGPARMRSGLKEIALEKWAVAANAWRTVATAPAAPGDTKLYGSWAPVPQLPAGLNAPGAEPSPGNVKLWLWSKTPFDYTRHSGSEWDEWFTSQYPDYPCVVIPPDLEVCVDFEKIGGEQIITSPWHWPEEPRIEVSWLAPDLQQVTILDAAIEGRTHALWFPHTVPEQHVLNLITITLDAPAKAVRLIVVSKSEVRAVAFDAANTVVGFGSGGTTTDPAVTIQAPDITRVVLHPSTETFLLGICVVRGPSAGDVAVFEEMSHHVRDELARWSQAGDVLEHHTAYRVRIVTTVETQEFPESSFNVVREQTEYAYFRTEGPPGLTTLSVPDGHQDPATFDSGLNDLQRYVRQTIPATVMPPGEPPVLPRPVYRAYDVGVEFNEDYVDLLYRLARRDLALYLYDANNQPVRDAQGRLIVLANRWGRTESLTLTESEQQWVSVINASTCATLDTTVFPHDTTVTSAAAGHVLEPDTVYEARLVPLLLHEDFGAFSPGASANGPAGALGGWVVHDRGANLAPSHWVVREEGTPPSRFVIQTTDIWGGTLEGRDPVKPGTILLRAGDPNLPAGHSSQPGNWTDYRVSVYLRSVDDDVIGVVFRYIDSSHHYFYAMDRQRTYRRVVRVVGGIHTVLAQDDFAYRLNQDYLVTIEAIGSTLRIHQDGSLVFDVEDDALDRGGIGLYCWGNNGARFSEVRVDDLGESAAPVYTFAFTTSQFANFYHQIHSFEDRTWPLELAAGEPPDHVVADLVAVTAASSDAVSEAEMRAYDELALAVLGEGANQAPSRLEVTKVTRGDTAIAFLVQSPEPVDWARSDLAVSRAPRHLPQPQRPGAMKITGVDLADESVHLLLRDALDPTGYRVEFRDAPRPIGSGRDELFWTEDFSGDAGGMLFEETFGANALDHYTIVDEATSLGPSAWSALFDCILQTSPIFGGSVSPTVADKPGTLALTGSPGWRNVRFDLAWLSPEHGAIGVVFRFKDRDNYYRFSVDRERNYQRLIKKVDGVATVLYEDQWTSTTGQTHHVVIDAYDDLLRCDMDDRLAFSVRDADLPAGSAGLYCWGNAGARFDRFTVQALAASPVLWQPTFAHVGEVKVVDADGATDGPSLWAVENGHLHQLSGIFVADTSPLRLGTYALAAVADWRDVQISVRLRADDDGGMGVVFRYIDADHYYRFSMDRTGSHRRLIKRTGNAVAVLWQDAVAYDIGTNYDVTVRAMGSKIRGYVDGTLLFAVTDADVSHGNIGFYSAANAGVHFERVVVVDLTRRVGAWTVHDEGQLSAPSSWKSGGGWMRQLSDIRSPDISPTERAKPGSHVVAGSAEWSDYRLTVHLRSDDPDAVGVMFRYVDDDNYYRYSLDARLNYRRLVKKTSGVLTVLWETAAGYPVGEEWTLTVDAAGPHLIGYVNGERTFDLRDDDHRGGKVGLYCWANAGVRFRRVEVRSTPLDAFGLLRDHFAEGDLTAWSFVDEGTMSAPSQWAIASDVLTQTSEIFSPPTDRDTLDKLGTLALAGESSWDDVVVRADIRSLDDDAIGLAFRYLDGSNYYRFSMDSERGYRRLVKQVGGAFTKLWEDARGYEAGRTYELTIAAVGPVLRGYLDGVPMFVVEDRDLTAGRLGLYCWQNERSEFSNVRVFPAELQDDNWMLDERFDRAEPDRWAFVDEGDHNGPSAWTIADNELRQTSDIAGGDSAGAVPAKPGTYAVAGDARWADYRFIVRLRSDDTDAIGAVIRYQDADNYYRFSMDAQRTYRRLIRNVAGEVSVLWEDSGNYVEGRDYVLTWDCAGDLHTLYLDGERLTTVADRALLHGKVGLYTWANGGARFSQLRVGPMTWSRYYAFSDDVRLAAGTRIRLGSGAPTPDATDVEYAIATGGEVPRRRLPLTECDLRLIAPDGSVGDRRSFLAASEYTPQDVRVLRKRDGTGLFVFVPDNSSEAGSSLPEGQYRLQFVYRRDNQAIDFASAVFSQAGVTTPEEATIDVNWD
jgi:hypothetical protein